MLSCTITSANATKRYNNLERATVPASSGEMEILPHHAETFVTLREGTITLHKSSQQTEHVHVAPSQCHIKHDSIVVIE